MSAALEELHCLPLPLRPQSRSARKITARCSLASPAAFTRHSLTSGTVWQMARLCAGVSESCRVEGGRFFHRLYCLVSALFPPSSLSISRRTALSGSASVLARGMLLSQERTMSSGCHGGALSHAPLQGGVGLELRVPPGVRLGGTLAPPAQITALVVAAAAGDAPLRADRINGGALRRDHCRQQ